MVKKCAICNINIKYGFFCYQCYVTWKDEIVSKQEWTMFLAKEEQKRRRERKREFTFIYLGDIWDIDTDSKLVFKEGYTHG